MSVNKVIKMLAACFAICIAIFSALAYFTPSIPFAAISFFVAAGQPDFAPQTATTPVTPLPTLARNIGDIITSTPVDSPANTIKSTGRFFQLAAYQRSLLQCFSDNTKSFKIHLAPLIAELQSLKLQVSTNKSLIVSQHAQINSLNASLLTKDELIEAGQMKLAKQKEEVFGSYLCKAQLAAFRSDDLYWLWWVKTGLAGVGLLAVGLAFNWCQKGSLCRNFTDSFALASSNAMLSHSASLQLKKELADSKKNLSDLQARLAARDIADNSSSNYTMQQNSRLTLECSQLKQQIANNKQIAKQIAEAHASTQTAHRHEIARRDIKIRSLEQSNAKLSLLPDISLAAEQAARISSFASQIASLTEQKDELHQTVASALSANRDLEAQLEASQLAATTSAQLSAPTTVIDIVNSMHASIQDLNDQVDRANKKNLRVLTLHSSSISASATIVKQLQATQAALHTQLNDLHNQASRVVTSLRNQIASEQKVTTTVPALHTQNSLLVAKVQSLEQQLAHYHCYSAYTSESQPMEIDQDDAIEIEAVQCAKGMSKRPALRKLPNGLFSR